MRYEADYTSSAYVTLTDEEINWLWELGLTIRRKALERGFSERGMVGFRPRTDAHAARLNALGRLAEGIVCKYMGWPFDVLGDKQGDCHLPYRARPDLPGRLQVRLIGAEHWGLRVYPYDTRDHRVVGVVIPMGREYAKRYRLAGWYIAGEAQRHEEWTMAPHGGPPMVAVPQSQLRPMVSLREMVLGAQDGRSVA